MPQHVAHHDNSHRENDLIAIVGASCRLPGGLNDLDGLWEALRAGSDLVTEVPRERFDAPLFTDRQRQRPGKTRTAAGGFLDDVAGFDAGFFGIAPKEATRMDPQQRLLLEMAVEALDQAGVCPADWAGTDVGVFIGVSSRDYGDLQSVRPATVNAYSMTGTSPAITANRISYVFDWRGESVALDTACSSSLTALHRACQYLRTGQGRAALAGGVNVILNPFSYVGFSSASMLSPSGRCRTFAADADGYVRAEGGGVVVLKRLGDALADGDRVQATVVATGTNCDGRTRGLALPHAHSQAELLRTVYGRAGIRPDDLVYFEAHGTGTPAGDPVECEAIGRALGEHRTTGALPIGSVKSNIGHLEAASGMPGLFKAMLVLRHGVVPPTLHADPLNPAIDFVRWRLRPALQEESLADRPRPVVGVNSFGFGGANAHVVLGPDPDTRPSAVALPAPRCDQQAVDQSPLPVLVSAHTPAALAEAARRMADRLRGASDEEFYDLARTTCLRRGHHRERAAVLAAGRSRAAGALAALATGRRTGAAASGHATDDGRIAFVFSGNGSQWPGMGVELMARDAAFRAAVQRVDAALTPLLGWSVRDALAGPVSEADLRRTEIAQPLLFAFQLGAVAALERAGVRPSAVTGHSFGEVAAACAAGVLDLPAAALLTAARSRKQALTAGQGRMAAVGLAMDDVREEIARYGGRLTVAAVNSDRDATVSGDRRDLDDLGSRLGERGVFFRLLDLDYAFHSTAMDVIEQPLRAELGPLRPAPGTVPFFSGVTGGALPGQRLDAAYWWRNIREPVLFADAVRALLDDGYRVFLEVGPHAVLGTYLKRLVLRGDRRPAVVRSCVRGGDGPDDLRQAVAQLMAVGGRIDWQAHFPSPGRPADLPAHPWQRERHWNGSPWWWSGTQGDEGAPVHPLLGTRLTSLEPLWSGPVEPSRLPWLGDHRIDDSVVMPAAAYLEMALAAAGQAFEGPVEIRDLRIVKGLSLPWDDDTADVRLQVSLSDEDQVLRVAARPDARSDWQLHARGRVRRLLRPAPEPVGPPVLGAPGTTALTKAAYYDRLSRLGLSLGPAFRMISGLDLGDGEVLATYATGLPVEGFRAHPVVLDTAMQLTGPLCAAVTGADRPFLPAMVETTRWWRPPPAEGWVRVRARDVGAAEARCDARLMDRDGNVTVELLGIRLRRFQTRARSPLGRWETTLRAAAHPRLAHPAASAPVPDVRSLAEAAARWRATADVTERLRRADDCARRLREVVAHFTAAAARQLLEAAGAEPPAAFSPDDLVLAGMAAKYRPLMDVLLPLAAEHGLLTREDPRGRRPGAVPEPRRALDEALRDLPEESLRLALYGRCGLHLADVVRGVSDPRELLHSDSDHRPADRFHSGPAMEAQTETVREVTRAVVAGWPADQPLRILEIGAGTGGMTDRLLDVLPPERTEYVYSDVSEAVLPRARRRFAGHGFVGYRTFDLDRAPEEQGFAPDSFDLLIAHHALHLARDLRWTATGLARLLAPGGLLIGAELHDAGLWAGCLGLLDEQWAFTDTGLRSTSPLLAAPRWEALLRDCGFSGTHVIGSGADGAATVSSVVLAGRAATTAPPAPCRPSPALPAGDARWIVAAEDPEGAPARELAALLAGSAPDRVSRTDLHDRAVGWAKAWQDGTGPVHAVLLLDGDPPPAGDAEAVTELAVRRIAAVAAFARAYARHDSPPVVALWLVTRSGVALGAPAAADRCGDSAPWGAVRCLANEHPGLTVRRIAAEADPGLPAVARRLALELLDPTDEDEVLLTGAGRFVVRSGPSAPARHRSGPPAPYRLELRDPGLSHRMAWVAAERPSVGPDEVLIEVRAVGLNYRDVMETLGMVRPNAEVSTVTGQYLGLECAGVVAAVGSRVEDLVPGDRVCAGALRCLASHVVTPRYLVSAIPATMSFAEAATLPMTFLTVHHALDHLARLTAGETLLVHGAAGGVGLAALQFARARGAELIATAGTPAKRDLLHLLGVGHVLDSRSLDFAEQVRVRTAGRGVDVVLNSLAGEALTRSAELLAPGGRFVELGKRDIEAGSRLPMGIFEDNVTFCSMELNQLLKRGPLPSCTLEDIVDQVRSGSYRPLPHQSYPAERVTEAFRALRHSRHLGKVVVTFGTPPPVEARTIPAAPDPAAAYLVTGGLSGLGAAIARHLADRGARHLVLVGRRGRATPGADELLRDLAARGARTTVHAADVCSPSAVREVLRDIEAAGRPLRGVVHAAMVLDDTPLSELTEDRIRTALRPKMLAALLLDAATAGQPLDFFVCCSSVTAVIGNRNQANYVAGNLFLEALARSRRAGGRHALTVGWGVIGDTGYVARAGKDDTWPRRGVHPLSSAEACAALDELLAVDATVAMTGRIDWERARSHFPALGAPRFGELAPAAGPGRPDDTERLQGRLAGADTEAAQELVAEVLRHAVADVLQTDPAHIDLQRPLDQLGMDSLMAAELVGVVARRLGCEIPAVELINASSINSLAARALARLGHGTD
ncbi:type I polyketide synthase [Streptomyces sp. I05A-00742]|uniref:type I polyketide synthase n=1 Tax=Streptomyces sp. I05A-00742 TaxID=2732853 RepID=UPI00148999A9|nr:type I polyketide synthase [Streptomyces sp. I05A-00742]